ncbi:MAG: hypothetical protein CMO01_00770 [Thalassobius sp.]|nr:hypothetical protein [Thalassovita sp.]
MSPGKARAQLGHAFTDTLLDALDADAPGAAAYAALRPGTKICLDGGSGDHLRRIAMRLDALGIPKTLIIDRDHVELPDFDGSPTLTALGVGPVSRDRVPGFLRNLKLL